MRNEKLFRKMYLHLFDVNDKVIELLKSSCHDKSVLLAINMLMEGQNHCENLYIDIPNCTVSEIDFKNRNIRIV